MAVGRICIDEEVTGYLKRSLARITTVSRYEIGDDMNLVLIAFIVGILVGVVLF